MAVTWCPPAFPGFLLPVQTPPTGAESPPPPALSLTNPWNLELLGVNCENRRLILDHGRRARLGRRPGQGSSGSLMLRFHIVLREVKRGVMATRPPIPIGIRCSGFDLVSECAADILLSEWAGRSTATSREPDP